MRIAFVCKHNQARSIIAANVIRRFYPDFQILSAGTSAITGSLIPQVILDIADYWQLKIQESSSTYIRDINSIEELDLIICADPDISDSVLKDYPKAKVQCIYDFSPSNDYLPIDPAGLSEPEIAIEVAKAALLSMNVIRSKVAKKNKVRLTLPTSNNRMQMIQSAKDWAIENGGVIIDADIQIPDALSWRQNGFEVMIFNPRSPEIKPFDSKGKPVVYVSKYEIDLPERIFLSIQWHEFIEKLNSKNAVAILKSSKDLEPNNYLALL